MNGIDIEKISNINDERDNNMKKNKVYDKDNNINIDNDISKENPNNNHFLLLNKNSSNKENAPNFYFNDNSFYNDSDKENISLSIKSIIKDNIITFI